MGKTADEWRAFWEGVASARSQDTREIKDCLRF